MKPGDLVKSKKHHHSMGIVTEVFDDISKDNPWVRVLFTHPAKTYQWCKMSSLEKVAGDKGPLTDTKKSGSL